MPTVRGLVFAFFHASMTAVGLLRDELGVVVWGGAFLLVELVVVIASAVGGVRLRAVRAGFTADLEQTTVDAGETVTVSAAIPRVSLFPGFTLQHDVRLSWDAGRTLAGSSVVESGTHARWKLAAPLRGDYRGEGSRLSLRDIFGFTSREITDARSLRLLVLPPGTLEPPPLPAQRGGERAAERTHRRVRSDERREVRPYVPGDDTRHLSWKHLAAYRELLIRVGEHVPPSRGEVHCRVDATVPDGFAAVRVGDALMEALRAMAREAGLRGVTLHCRVPGGAVDFATPADVSAAASLIAGFVPRGEPAPRGGSAGVVITAREGLRGAYTFSVRPLLDPAPRRDAGWRRLVVREAP